MLEKLKERGFEIQFQSHAAAILERDFPEALADIEKALLTFEVPIAEIIDSGGGETKGIQESKLVRTGRFHLRAEPLGEASDL